MTSKEFQRYLNSIGGLENGWTSVPNKSVYPIQNKMFLFCQKFWKNDRKNPFRSKIKDRGFFSVNDGWLNLIRNLIDELIKAGWDKEIVQVKEKFGGLRFYIGGGNDTIFKIITKYETLSYSVCEDCGQPGQVRTGGWIRTLCDVHFTKK